MPRSGHLSATQGAEYLSGVCRRFVIVNPKSILKPEVVPGGIPRHPQARGTSGDQWGAISCK